jgi:hypothetical protein
MGFLREALGVRRRFRRCQEHWREHIENCHAMIRQGIQRCERRRRAAILGAGLLHDVPVQELSDSFEEVLLVDIVHPWSSRFTPLPGNVRRVMADVTDTVSRLYAVADDPDEPLPQVAPSWRFADDRLDFTVSLNLLSQLPCMPLEYAARFKAHSVEQMTAYAKGVVNAHLSRLRSLPGVVTLITDIERLKIDMMRRVVERRDLMYGRRIERIDAEWVWKLAPCPEADPRHDFFRAVVGIVNLKEAQPVPD